VAINSSPADLLRTEQEAAGPEDPVPTRSAFTVAVIGSARLTPPDPRSVLAAQIGAAIAAEGWVVMTGGYGGLMEVTSRAAAEAGGTVIGLPMRGWSALTPNRWNHELRWSDSYPERLAHLLAADAIIALDGGIGTLSEAAVAWAALQTEPVAADLILLGAGWPSVLRSLAGHLVVDDRDLAQVTICADSRHAIAHIAENRSGRQRATGPRG
jgi:uncharacterized protein (TIGR00725 family)